jgi:hypothetical protein
MDNAMFDKMLAQALEAKRAENTNKQTEEIELLQFDSYAEQVDELMKISHRIVNPPTKQRKWIPGLPGIRSQLRRQAVQFMAGGEACCRISMA